MNLNQLYRSILGRVALGFMSVILSQEVGAHYCQLDPVSYIGFTSIERLPANAKGVLFRFGQHELYKWSPATIGTSGNLLVSIPSPLNAESFFITEEGSSRRIKAIVERVEEPAEVRFSRPLFYQILDPTLRACLERSPLDRAMQTKASSKCDVDLQKKLDDDLTVQDLLKAKKIRDVTNSIRAGRGLVRVRPAQGFVAGKIYQIKFLGTKFEKTYLQYRYDMRLQVDPAIAPEVMRQFAVISLQKREFESIDGERTNLQSNGKFRSQVQSMQLDLLPELEPYRHGMQFSTKYKFVANDAHAISREIAKPSCGGKRVFAKPGNDEFQAKCTASNSEGSDFYVQVQIVFPELFDAPQKTPEHHVSFSNSETETCYGEKFFRDTLKRKNINDIREMVCDLSRAGIGNVNAAEYLAPLMRLAHSDDVGTSACSASSLLKVAEKISLSTQDAQSIFELLLVRKIDRSLLGQQAENGLLSEFLRTYIKQLEANGTQIDGRVFQAQLPTLLSVLKNQVQYSEKQRTEVLELITLLGESAASLYPELLNLARKDISVNYFEPLFAMQVQDSELVNLAFDIAEKPPYFAREALYDYEKKIRRNFEKSLADNAIDVLDAAKFSVTKLVQHSHEDEILIERLLLGSPYRDKDLIHFVGLGARAQFAAKRFLQSMDGESIYERMRENDASFILSILRIVHARKDAYVYAYQMMAKSSDEKLRIKARQALALLEE